MRALTPALSSFIQDVISLPWVLAGASTHSSGKLKAVLVDPPSLPCESVHSGVVGR